MPLWNKAHAVERAVQSVLAQSFGGFELIVVDDGSTDGGPELVRELRDPRIRVLHQENAGPGAARNTGVEVAQEAWVAFIDGDDIWLPDHLFELDRVRRACPEAGLIGTGFIESDSAGAYELPLPKAGHIRSISYFRSIGRGENPFWTSSAAIPKRVYHALGGFKHERIGEDRELWTRIALAMQVAVSSRKTAVYMRGTNGIMDNAAERWRGKELRSAADLSPAVATALEAYPDVASPELREDIDRFVDKYVEYCLTASAMVGDVATVRKLRHFYRREPPPHHRLLLSLASLPEPVARLAYLHGPKLKRGAAALVRALQGFGGNSAAAEPKQARIP